MINVRMLIPSHRRDRCPEPVVDLGIERKADCKVRPHRKSVSAATPRAVTTATWNLWPSTEVREHFRRMDRRTSVTAPTMQRKIIHSSCILASWYWMPRTHGVRG